MCVTDHPGNRVRRHVLRGMARRNDPTRARERANNLMSNAPAGSTWAWLWTFRCLT
jgi:hypothetical protein